MNGAWTEISKRPHSPEQLSKRCSPPGSGRMIVITQVSTSEPFQLTRVTHLQAILYPKALFYSTVVATIVGLRIVSSVDTQYQTRNFSLSSNYTGEVLV
uniref:Uncharacterized protein n=1 Tax=Anguilla anguilla TaxID=7936 RepID=A0A0E9TMN5_ANGAN